MKRPVITLLTDFGASDHYAGAMKGVMLGICPEAQLVDITHEITPFAITEAAFTLSQSWSCFPKGTVHLVVVDPGVGSARRPLLVEAAGHYFVTPDNGVLTMLYDLVPSHAVREITATRYFRQRVSRTFHGRDIFAPVAAYLAGGIAPAEFGMKIEDPVQLDFAKPVRIGPEAWKGTILKIDRFGNLITNFSSETWAHLTTQPFQMDVGMRAASRLAFNYAEVPAGELFVIGGSAGFLEISVNQESAAKMTGARSRTPVGLRLL